MAIALQTIIKRDGTEQVVNLAKLKGWSRWACSDLPTVNWTKIFSDVINSVKETKLHSQDLQKKLINRTLMEGTYESTIMAGRLYVAYIRKKLFDSTKLPSCKAVYEAGVADGLLDNYLACYTQDNWDYVESIIDHNRDFDMTHGEVIQLQHKYSIRNRVKNKTYESPQHTYMRLAMFFTNERTGEDWKQWVKDYYDEFSLKRASAPSPNFINGGTKHNGLASCCLFTASDTKDSISAAHAIVNNMSAASAGIGGSYNLRSINDPVRGGAIKHGGKLPYIKTAGALVQENITAGRGGAANLYYSAYDPEAIEMMVAQNPMTPLSKQNRDVHMTAIFNAYIVEKALLGHKVFVFNCFTHPKLYDVMFDKDPNLFRTIYEEIDNNPVIKKTYVEARELLKIQFQQWFEVSTNYRVFIDEINRHTPHLDIIHTSNLCTEVTQPTKPYICIEDLYLSDHHRGEVSICNLGAVVVYNIHSDAQYEKTTLIVADMIDKCIDRSDYVFPHIAYTAKMRRNAGIGLMGPAYVLAKEGLSITTVEGRNRIHEMGERHAYFCLKAALTLGKERGNAPWIHKTKWPQGWLWIDTYNRNVDELVTCKNKYDWEAIRQEVIANGGIRFSSLITFMPGESSSKATGSPNSVYLLRSQVRTKTDEDNILTWVAPQPKNDYAMYEISFTTSIFDQVKMYAVWQKWVDQAISADFDVDRSKISTVSEDYIYRFYAACVKYGIKSNYYLVTESGGDETVKCGSGGCTV